MEYHSKMLLYKMHALHQVIFTVNTYGYMNKTQFNPLEFYPS